METKIYTFREVSRTFARELSREGSRRVLDGFGDDFGKVLEGFGRPGGTQMETEINEFRGHFATPSQEPSKGGFWEGSGWIWGAFSAGFGRIWEPWGVQMDMKNDTFRGKFMSFP